jgi:hypothetical protein
MAKSRRRAPPQNSPSEKVSVKLSPTPDHLTQIINTTAALFGHLKEAGLIEGLSPALTPDAIHYRKTLVIVPLLAWEAALNPCSLPSVKLPVYIGNWPDSLGLMLALSDLYSVREELIRLWEIEEWIRARSVEGNSQLEKPQGWPPPLPAELAAQSLRSIETLEEFIRAHEGFLRAQARQEPSAPTQRRRDRKRDERNEWMSKLAEDSQTYKQIRLKLQRIAESKGWECLDTDNGVRIAIKRHRSR